MTKKVVTDENGKKYILKEHKPFYKKPSFWLTLTLATLFIIESNEEAAIENIPTTTK